MAEHVRHADGFRAAWPEGPPARVLDLGSGGGVPGLVLARSWPLATFVLLDANQRRAAFLERAVEAGGLAGRVVVVRARAEEVGRTPAYRGGFDAVVARGFGPPAVAAECGAPFLAAGGQMVVSEPPDAEGERWPAAGLAHLGMTRGPAVRAGATYQILVQVVACPERFPRRTGVPAKRPLF